MLTLIMTYSEYNDARRLHWVLRWKYNSTVIDATIELRVSRASYSEMPLEQVVLQQT